MKQPDIATLKNKEDVLERIGHSTEAYCYRNNVFCEWGVCDDVLTLQFSGYDIDPIKEYWQSKLPNFEIREKVSERDNVFIHVVTLE